MDNRSSSLIGFFDDLSLTSAMIPLTFHSSKRGSSLCPVSDQSSLQFEGDHSRLEVTSQALSIEPLSADPIDMISHNTNTAMDSSAI